MRSKGFTLWELLAVITILGLIALIVIPIVSKMIDESKENAAKRSAELYLDAVRISISNKNVESNFPSSRVICSILEEDTHVGKIKYNQGDLKCNDSYIRVGAEKGLPLKGRLIIENEEIDKSSVWLEMKNSYIFGYKNDILTRLDKDGIDQINEYLIASLSPGLYTEDLESVKTWDELLNLDLVLDSGDSNAELLNSFSSGKILVIGSKDSIEYIGDNAFAECSNLTNIIISDSISSIGLGSFSGCTSLVSVKIPSSVTRIGEEAFWDCISLTSIMVPSSVIEIGEFAFYNCSGLESILVDSNNEYYDSMGSNAIIEIETNTLIIGCKNTIIPSSVEIIGYAAFYGNEGLTSITIPSSVVRIYPEAFSGCTNLSSITIENGLTYITDYAFSGCTSLTSVTIPSSVIYIGEGAFSGCTTLANIELKSGLQTIENHAFEGCISLTSIYIPSSVTYMGAYIFCERDNSLEIHCGALDKPEDWDDLWNYYDDSNSWSVVWGSSS